MRETIARAERYAKALRREPGLTRGGLAQREGVSGPRVNQILAILRLEPSILADADAAAGPFLGLGRHLFARARTWQAMLDAGEARSVAALARQVKVSRHQMGRVLDLLTLPPEVQAALDVPAEELPEGVTQAKVKGLARLDGAAAQRAAWAEMVGAMSTTRT